MCTGSADSSRSCGFIGRSRSGPGPPLAAGLFGTWSPSGSQPWAEREASPAICHGSHRRLAHRHSLPSTEGQTPWGPPLSCSCFIFACLAALGLRCGSRSPTRGHGVSLQGPPGKSPSQGLCYFVIVLVERKLFFSVKLCGLDVASLQTSDQFSSVA